MEYAHLQLGQDAKAKQVMEEMKATQLGTYPNVAVYTAMVAIPARYYLERQDWKGASQLEPLGSGFPANEWQRAVADGITYFGIAMGFARSGDAASANSAVDKLKAQRETLLRLKQGYWAEQVEVQVLGAQAWVEQTKGDKGEALKFMRAAADLEDGSEKHVAMENRLYPMRELLADMLREQGDAASALKEYEASMKNAPNRLRAYYGCGKAATALGQTKKADACYRQLVRLARNSDSERPEIQEVAQLLASK
ncbi:MAG: tetratricopeptide repeat protein [Betaproteobacteria bacterium]|nr:tetratricopeptide repeat protein [Betaproteobacteria bacterium]